MLISYYFKLDYFVVSLIILSSFFDLFKSKLLSSHLNNTLLLIVSIFFIFIYFLNLDLFLYIIFIQLFLVLFSFVFKSYVSNLFPIIIIIFLYLLTNLSVVDRNILYLCFLLSFFNDTSAYIFGNLIKGPLILPSISPKKTWSGTLISTFISIIIFNVLGYNYLFSFICGISFFIGDIYFSYIKRLLHIKDFSNLLRSHGGILDRLDSIFLLIIFFSTYLHFS